MPRREACSVFVRCLGAWFFVKSVENIGYMATTLLDVVFCVPVPPESQHSWLSYMWNIPLFSLLGLFVIHRETELLDLICVNDDRSL